MPTTACLYSTRLPTLRHDASSRAVWGRLRLVFLFRQGVSQCLKGCMQIKISIYGRFLQVLCFSRLFVDFFYCHGARDGKLAIVIDHVRPNLKFIVVSNYCTHMLCLQMHAINFLDHRDCSIFLSDPVDCVNLVLSLFINSWATRILRDVISRTYISETMLRHRT